MEGQATEGQNLSEDEVKQLRRVLPVLEEQLKEMAYYQAEMIRLRKSLLAGGATGGAGAVPMDNSAYDGLADVQGKQAQKITELDRRVAQLADALKRPSNELDARLKVLEERIQVVEKQPRVSPTPAPKTRVMRCPSCMNEKVVDLDTVFCTDCGTYLQPSSAE